MVRTMLITSIASAGARRLSFGCAALAWLRIGFSASIIVFMARRILSMSWARGPGLVKVGWLARIKVNRAFFGAGLLLSVYRDRLRTLPDRFKRREGVFRVLTWR